jgi:hypothetical protein
MLKLEPESRVQTIGDIELAERLGFMQLQVRVYGQKQLEAERRVQEMQNLQVIGHREMV